MTGQAVRLVVDGRNKVDLLERGESLHLGSGHMLRRDPQTGQVSVHHRGTGERLDIATTLDGGCFDVAGRSADTEGSAA